MNRSRTTRAALRLGLLAAPLLALSFGCAKGKPEQKMPPPPGVTVAKPVMYKVQNYYEYNGYLDAVDSVEVRARVKGLLKEILFEEGKEVAKGDPLYQINPREFESAVAKANADIAKASADIAKAESDIAKSDSQIDTAKAQIIFSSSELKRQEALRDATSGSDLQKARSTAAVDKANLKASEAAKLAAAADKDAAEAGKLAAQAALRTAELNLSYTSIKAEITGLMSRTLVTPGNLVGQSETTLLTTIIRQDKLFIYFDAPERDLVQYLQRIRSEKTQPASAAPVQIGVATEEGFPHQGSIDFRDNRVDSSTGTVRVRGRIDNPKMPPGNSRLLYPGLFARVRVPYGDEKPMPAIPEDALMTGQEGRYVYIVDDKGAVSKRTVTVGPQVYRAPPPDRKDAPRWTVTEAEGKAGPPVRSVVAIASGLTAEDTVIINGLQKVRPGAPVTPQPATLNAPAQAAPEPVAPTPAAKN